MGNKDQGGDEATPKNKYQLDLNPDVKEEAAFLSFDDFSAIDFGLKSGERFAIVNDVLEYLTNQPFANLDPNKTMPTKSSVDIIPAVDVSK